MGNLGCHGRTEQGDPNNSREHGKKALQKKEYVSYDLKYVSPLRTV